MKKKIWTASSMAKQKAKKLGKAGRTAHALKMVRARKWHPVKGKRGVDK